MRSSTEIKAQIEALRKADRAYNNVVNEGGEGYERDSVSDALVQELMSAIDREFAAEWTLDVFNARRAAWNAEILKISNGTGEVSCAQIAETQKKLGIRSDDIKKAKKLLNA